ncbi:MAG TPA: hypothetical protein VL171_01435 [Verrucomicrobiae bacterium]|nr:hypothetical protein [Verrucomicrobiae bacterium]
MRLGEQLERQLDDFDPAVRRRALQEISEQGHWPQPTAQVNLHSHTFFSYNAYGYSPTHFAVLARQRGLMAAGIVDFDVLDGLEEFLEAGRLLELKACVSLESRVYVPEFADRVINSPGEPGISYHMGIGFPREIEHPLLTQMRRTAEQRNRELLARVNAFTAPVVLDYDRDVLPLTPKGNATERHICEAYSKKGDQEFWRSKLGECPDEPAKLQALIRAKTMKRGGVGYVQPGKGAFPLMAQMNQFVLEAGAIPTLTWLDGTSEGEQCLEELFEVAEVSGAAALNIIPDRNYTPGAKDQKLQNLREVIALAEKHHFLIVVGTEMNAPGNKFVDSFETAELKPFLPVFLKGAYIVFAHTLLQRHLGRGYLSDWAKQRFPGVAERNDFFERLGRELSPNVTTKELLARVQ